MFKTIASLSPACLLVAVPVSAQDAPAPAQATPAVFVVPDQAIGTVPDASVAAEPHAPGFAASFAAPRDADGGYRTPNRDLSPAEVTWHVRAALNVAALGCRDEASAYNAMLVTEKAPLADADAAVKAADSARYGADGEAHHDDAMTKLYNYWAQPPAQAGFCAAADAVLQAAVNVEPADFPAFAAAALPRLEAPFLRAFASADAYRTELAAWRARHAATLAKVAVAAPVVIAIADAPVIVPAAR